MTLVPDPSRPVFHASAPGRLDVMGGIADYSGALVLQLPLRETTQVSLQLRTDGMVTICSDQVAGTFKIRYDSLLQNGQLDVAFARKQLATHSGGDWAAYVVGCLLAVQQYKGVKITGLDVHINSEVPTGKGVSSSAALEVATLRALTHAYSLSWTGTELPRLAQWVENQIVGAPCGLMDQLASEFGKSGHLLPIHCQPDLVSEPIPIPDGIHFVGIDSGIRHAVSGASYSDVRAAAFAGYSLLASKLGVSNQKLLEVREKRNLDTLPFGGYLAAWPIDSFDREYRGHLPEWLSGKDFLADFEATIDPVTNIQPNRMYPVRAATCHPVHEQQRVERFRQGLLELPQTTSRTEVLQELGQLMYASHQSYSACGLGHARTDELVDMARKAGRGVYGAKITGGGSGGTVCLLCDGEEGKATARSIYQDYCQRYGDTYFFE